MRGASQRPIGWRSMSFTGRRLSLAGGAAGLVLVGLGSVLVAWVYVARIPRGGVDARVLALPSASGSSGPNIALHPRDFQSRNIALGKADEVLVIRSGKLHCEGCELAGVPPHVVGVWSSGETLCVTDGTAEVTCWEETGPGPFSPRSRRARFPLGSAPVAQLNLGSNQCGLVDGSVHCWRTSEGRRDVRIVESSVRVEHLYGDGCVEMDGERAGIISRTRDGGWVVHESPVAIPDPFSCELDARNVLRVCGVVHGEPVCSDQRGRIPNWPWPVGAVPFHPDCVVLPDRVVACGTGAYPQLGSVVEVTFKHGSTGGVLDDVGRVRCVAWRPSAAEKEYFEVQTP